jgi:hypothetical protein
MGWLTVAVLFVLYIRSLADRYLMALMVEPIKQGLHLTDTAVQPAARPGLRGVPVPLRDTGGADARSPQPPHVLFSLHPAVERGGGAAGLRAVSRC